MVTSVYLIIVTSLSLVSWSKSWASKRKKNRNWQRLNWSLWTRVEQWSVLLLTKRVKAKRKIEKLHMSLRSVMTSWREKGEQCSNCMAHKKTSVKIICISKVGNWPLGPGLHLSFLPSFLGHFGLCYFSLLGLFSFSFDKNEWHDPSFQPIHWINVFKCNLLSSHCPTIVERFYFAKPENEQT